MNEKLPYDITKAESIFNYSIGLLEKTLRDFVQDDYKQKAGKGQLGQMVEEIYFLLRNNSNPNADFSTAGVELKCTPLNKGRQGEYKIKERLACGMINYCEVVNEDFETSHFYLKCQLMLILFYLHQKNTNALDLKFIFSVLWKLPEKDLIIIKNDYDTIIAKIKRGEAHLLSEGDTLYLGACHKGQKGDKPVKQPFSDIPAAKRAFSLKPAYMRTILAFVVESKKNAIANYTLKGQQLVSFEELKNNNFEKTVLGRIEPYLHLSYQQIANSKNIDLSKNPKNKFSIISSIIASNGTSTNINRTEEFTKAGMTMKTIRVEANGIIKEAMSFENIDYVEIAQCDDWYDSRLFEIFSSRFMFVVYREQHQGEKDYVLDDAFFWTMPKEDLDTAQRYWEHIRENVLANHISEEYWWKGADKKKFHVRPKARNSSDLATTIEGKKVKKFCYWFNNEYVRDILSQRRNNNDRTE